MIFLRSEEGNALIEMALVLPIFFMIVLGCVNLSLQEQEAMQVTEAANAGASFGIIPGNQANLLGMENAASNAAANVTGFTVTATRLWSCTAGGAAATSTTVCTGTYSTPLQYVQVNTSATAPALFSWPGTSANITLQGSATIRVPWQP